jgi:hypothetical protein
MNVANCLSESLIPIPANTFYHQVKFKNEKDEFKDELEVSFLLDFAVKFRFRKRDKHFSFIYSLSCSTHIMEKRHIPTVQRFKQLTRIKSKKKTSSTSKLYLKKMLTFVLKYFWLFNLVCTFQVQFNTLFQGLRRLKTIFEPQPIGSTSFLLEVYF